MHILEWIGNSELYCIYLNFDNQVRSDLKASMSKFN